MRRGACVVCGKEAEAAIGPDGRVTIAAWIPPGGGTSVYAIVRAHLKCMSVDQLRQAIDSERELQRSRGHVANSMGFYDMEARLSELLARGERGPRVETEGDGERFGKLDIDWEEP